MTVRNKQIKKAVNHNYALSIGIEYWYGAKRKKEGGKGGEGGGGGGIMWGAPAEMVRETLRRPRRGTL